MTAPIEAVHRPIPTPARRAKTRRSERALLQEFNITMPPRGADALRAYLLEKRPLRA